MAKRRNTFVRGIGALLASGMLWQAGSCALDPSTLTQSLVSLAARNFISSIVFNAFGVPLTRGF